MEGKGIKVMKVTNISKTYHNKHSVVLALDHLSLEINHAGITAIVGSSGCGKTTLLHILSGQDMDFEGERSVDGTIEIIEQDIMLFEAMSVQDNLRMVADNIEEITHLLKRFKMTNHAREKVKKLSIGQKKRVQLMRSLLNRPDYLLCDEPTAALDHDNAEIVMQMLKEISKSISVIVVTHDIDLVECYADQIVFMKKGNIERTEIRHKREILTPEAHSSIRKSLKRHGFTFIKSFSARIGEQILCSVLVFVLSLSMFGTFLFDSVSQTVDEREKWRTGSNILTPQPNKGNNIFRGDEENIVELEYSSGSFYYDLYSDDDIQLVKDNIPEVIGYRCGWNVSLYSQYGSWLPRISYNQAVDLIGKADAEVRETGRDYTDFELYVKGRLESLAKEEQQNLEKFYITDFSNQNKINNQTSVLREDASLLFAPLLRENSNVRLYQIFDHSKLPVQYGRWMEQDDEIVVPYDVAVQIQKVEAMSSPEEVLGITCSASLPRRTGNEIGGTYESQKVASFTIVGITYYGNDSESLIFLREGAWDKLRAAFYGFQEDVNYQYVDFIIDAKTDSQTIIERLDELLDSSESHFVTKATSSSVEEEYQNTVVFYVFIISICICMVAILIISHLVVRKREKKESALLRWYGYHPFLIALLRVLCIFLVVGIIQVLFFPTISKILNQLASSLGFDSMLNQDIGRYLVSLGISLIIVLLIEFAFQCKQKGR